MPYQDNKCQCVGQVPGGVYSNQVIDEQGNGLFAGWFFLDSDGVPIMNDTRTDENGYFHYTVPLFNHENIFIQFFATSDYEPLVLSFEELVNSSGVVLKKKVAGGSPVLIGAVMLAAIIVLSKWHKR